MQSAVQPTPAAPRRRAVAAKPAAESKTPAVEQASASAPTTKPAVKAKKLSAAAVEATAAAFMAGFKALPGAVQWRVVQLIEAQEDDADARELEALQQARPADFNPEDLITLEEYITQRRAREQPNASAEQRLAA